MKASEQVTLAPYFQTLNSRSTSGTVSDTPHTLWPMAYTQHPKP